MDRPAPGDTVIFLGPSRPGFDAAAHGMIGLPPARRGDVAALIPRRPAAIALVDGAFETAPSVWHKELLLALKAGIAVYGAASLGALRAAELHPFGMQGVGRIFEAYRSGALTRDDAVMVCHGPAALGYLATSISLVDMRATIDAAGPALSPAERTCLTAVADDLFFKDRTWDRLIATATARLGPAASPTLATRLRRFRTSRKQADVATLLQTLAAPPPAPATDFDLPATSYLRDLIAERDATDPSPPPSAPGSTAAGRPRA